MTYKDLTFNELTNCRIIAKKESFLSGREVSFQEVAEREISKLHQGLPSIIYPREEETLDNVGKYIYLEFSDNEIVKVRLIESDKALSVNDNEMTTASPIGKLVRHAKKDDLVMVKSNRIKIINICSE